MEIEFALFPSPSHGVMYRPPFNAKGTQEPLCSVEHELFEVRLVDDNILWGCENGAS